MNATIPESRSESETEPKPGSRVYGDRGSDAWRRVLQVVLVAGASGLVFAQPFRELVHVGESNVLAHVDFARRIAETGNLFPGHFLFHVATVFVHHAFGVLHPLTWEQANVAVNVAARMVTAVILWVWARRALESRDSLWSSAVAVVLPVAILFASAITMPTWGSGNYYLGYLPPNIYVSQTMVVVQPLALLTSFAIVRVLAAERHAPAGRDVAILAVLSVLSVLAKPNYEMVMVPAFGILLLVQVATRRGARSIGPHAVVAGSVFVPVVLVMGWIYVSTYLETQAQFTDAGGSGVIIRPFLVMKAFQGAVEPSNVGTWLVAKLLLSIAFPLAVTIAYWSRARRDLRFQLGWLQLVFGLVFSYLFAETGGYESGNFTWSAQTAVFILMALSALFLLEQARGEPGTDARSRRSVATQLCCWSVFALHVVGGLGPFLHPTIS